MSSRHWREAASMETCQERSLFSGIEIGKVELTVAVVTCCNTPLELVLLSRVSKLVWPLLVTHNCGFYENSSDRQFSCDVNEVGGFLISIVFFKRKKNSQLCARSFLDSNFNARNMCPSEIALVWLRRSLPIHAFFCMISIVCTTIFLTFPSVLHCWFIGILVTTSAFIDRIFITGMYDLCW